MGCFDYQCECRGKTCQHVGAQLHDAYVIIEVPLNDDSIAYIKGYYEEYGCVAAGGYKFYLEEFKHFFEGWFYDESEKERSKSFLATKVWTYCEEIVEDDDEQPGMVMRPCCPITHFKNLTSQIVKKCIRADKELIIPTDKEKRELKIKDIETHILMLQKQLHVLKLENL